MRLSPRSAFIAFFTLALLCCRDTKGIGPEIIDLWQTEQGLPQSAVSCVLQTGDGYLWIGTFNGLARFDGVRFVVFDSSNTPELSSNRVTCLSEDRQGSLWVGLENGTVSRLKDGLWSHSAAPRNWPGGAIEKLGVDADGDLWLLHRSGLLVRWQDGRVIAPGPADGRATVPSLIEGASGKLWVQRNHALSSIDKGELVAAHTSDSKHGTAVLAACESRNGGIWTVLSDGICLWRDGVPVVDLGPPPWGVGFVSQMIETRSGQVVIGTLEHGLFLLSPDAPPRQISRNEGLAHDWVRSLCEDREGNLWVATGGGLHELRPYRVAMIQTSDEWEGRAVRSICRSRDGAIWAGTEGAALYRLQGSSSKQLSRAEGVNSPFIWSVLEDREGKVWAGSWGQGLFVRQGEVFKAAPGWNAAANVVAALYQAPSGTMWAGSNLGAARLIDQQWQCFTDAGGESFGDVRAILEESPDVVWFGTSGNGLICWRQGAMTRFRKTDGLPNDFVWSLYLDREGVLWIGTAGGGLGRMKNGKVAAVGTRQGLPNNVVCHIEEDDSGHLWISSYGGLFRVSKDELNRCADGTLSKVFCLVLDKSDGLTTGECSGGFQPSGFRSDDGRLWFPTTKGLAIVDPARLATHPVAPPVVVEEIVVDEEIQPKGTTITVPPGPHRVEIRYTALSFLAPAKVRFRHRLSGLEEGWIEAGSQRMAHYSYLPPGRYDFRVTACNDDGVWNETGAGIALIVQPHLWQTWWFRAGSIAGSAILLTAIVRLVVWRRARRRLELIERQRALERERSRIAQDIHDDLGASLTRISLLSQSVRADFGEHESADDLDQICTTARTLTRAMDEIVWAVNPRHDSLDSLVTYLGRFAPQFLESAGIRCRIDFPLQLPSVPLSAEVRHNLFLAVKEALHNLVKHAHANEVSMALEKTADGFTLSVRDDGKGFPTEGSHGDAVSGFANGRAGGGNGLGNMRRRLAEIGGRCAIESARGRGTQISFHVPWPS